MKFTALITAVIVGSICLTYIQTRDVSVESVVYTSWSIVKYALAVLINSMVVLFLVSVASAVLTIAHFMYEHILLFQTEHRDVEEVMNDMNMIWIVETEPDVPGQSGDHPEFFDIPEIANAEAETNRETRQGRRRRRMVSTLLQENSRDPSRERRRQTIEDSLRESEDTNFQTPLPSPRFTDDGHPSIPNVSEHENTIEIQTRPEKIIQRSSSNNKTPRDKSTNPNKYTTLQLQESKPVEQVSPQIERTNSKAPGPKRVTLLKPILHQFPRGITKPSLSCDGMFIETYIRLIGIACDISTDCIDTNGPWMQFSNKKAFGVKDCITRLKENFTDTAGLFTVEGERRGVSWSLTLLVDHLYMGLMCWRWVVEDAKEFVNHQPGWDRICTDQEQSKKSVKDKLWAVGFGKMSYKEVTDAILKDLETLSEFLGESSFLLGETPTEVDCYTFSVVCQIEWGEESVLRDSLRELSNVQNYCVRVKNLLWPDWDDHLAIVKDSDTLERVGASECMDGDENGTGKQSKKSPSKTHFTKSFYELLPAEETISEIGTEGNGINSCACDADLVYVCTRCTTTTTELTTVRNSNAMNAYFSDDRRSTRIKVDGDMIATYGVEEYFDDEFEDMESISYQSSESKGESHV